MRYFWCCNFCFYLCDCKWDQTVAYYFCVTYGFRYLEVTDWLDVATVGLPVIGIWKGGHGFLDWNMGVFGWITDYDEYYQWSSDTN